MKFGTCDWSSVVALNCYNLTKKIKNGNQLEKIKKVVDKEVCHMYNSLSVDRSKVCY